MAETTTEQAKQAARDAILRSWRGHAIGRRGGIPEGWHDESVVGLARAVVDRAGIRRASDQYGRDRYLAGWTHGETLDDIEDLSLACPSIGSTQILAMMRSAAGGWVDEMTTETVSLPHRDLLTGLPTVGFVVVAAELLYHRPDADPAATHSLVIAQIPPDLRPADRISAMLHLSDHARTVFDERCTVAMLGSFGVIALIENTASHYATALALPPSTGILRGLRVRLEPLPPTREQVEPHIARHARHRLPPAT